MRSVLARHKDRRLTFVARLECFGMKHGNEKTVLLKDICDGEGNRVCGHLWLGATREFNGIDEGETVQFAARVIGYIKGYRGQKPGERHKPIQIDYALSRPTKVRKLGG